MVDENPRRGFDWPRESEANTARSRITVSGRNPKGGEGTECDWAVPSLSLLERGEWNWNEVNVLSNPSHSLEWVRMLSYWERTWGNWKWPNDPIPHPPWERALELWEGERSGEMKWADCPIPLLTSLKLVIISLKW